VTGGDVTRLLSELGDSEGAGDELFALVYDELRALAAVRLRAERDDHTLSATALAHEAYLKLVDQRETDWKNRAHFFAITARAMRRLLLDHARARLAEKRGGDVDFVTLGQASGASTPSPEELIELDDALERLVAMDARQAAVVEYRFYVGLKDAEIAEVLGVSVPTVRRDWRSARAWLRSQLDG